MLINGISIYTNSGIFTGKFITFNMQTKMQYFMQYNNGKLTHVQVLQEKTHLSSLTSIQGIAGNIASITNSISTVGKKATNGFFADLWCLLIGGQILYGEVNGCYAAGGWLLVFEDGGPGNPDYNYVLQELYDHPDNNAYNFNYYTSNDGSGANLTALEISQMGGGVFWVAPPRGPNNDNDGCAVVANDVKTKTLNSVHTQNTGGCPEWTPYPFNLDDLVLLEEQGLPELDISGLANYPDFRRIVIDLPNFLKKFPNVTKALAHYTGFSESKIIALMQPGKGPKVQVVANLTNTYGQPLYGYYVASSHTLQISETYVNLLNSTQSDKALQAASLLLAITTLHEFVHYGRDANHLTDLYTDPSNGQSSEAGLTFEMNINNDGTIINKNNAIDWINFYPYNFY